MSKENDGGLAFPFFDERVMNTPEYGMSLRDYFAAKAMEAMVARYGYQPCRSDELATNAFDCADAMLEARK